MKNKIPITLIYSRLVLGFLLVALAFFKIQYFAFFSIFILSLGLITDIFDGIIARQLNISSEKLRRLDSTIDQIFFTSVLVAAFIHCPEFFKSNWIKLSLIVGFEILAYLVCYVKFKREIATHSIGAKVWTLFLFATIVEIFFSCQSILIFNLCFYIGILTRIEIIAIILILKNWVTDVPTFYHAIKLRQGKEIKRHKLFNG